MHNLILQNAPTTGCSGGGGAASPGEEARPPLRVFFGTARWPSPTATGN